MSSDSFTCVVKDSAKRTSRLIFKTLAILIAVVILGALIPLSISPRKFCETPTSSAKAY